MVPLLILLTRTIAQPRSYRKVNKQKIKASSRLVRRRKVGLKDFINYIIGDGYIEDVMFSIFWDEGPMSFYTAMNCLMNFELSSLF